MKHPTIHIANQNPWHADTVQELLEVLQLAKATINRLHRHAPGSAKGTLDVIDKTIAKTKERVI